MIRSDAVTAVTRFSRENCRECDENMDLKPGRDAPYLFGSVTWDGAYWASLPPLQFSIGWDWEQFSVLSHNL